MFTPICTNLPVVEGRYRIDRIWSLDLPERFERRIVEGGLVFSRTGLMMWVTTGETDRELPPKSQWLCLKNRLSDEAYDLEESHDDETLRVSYRLIDERDDGAAPGFYGLIVGDESTLRFGAYADDETGLSCIRAVWLSIRHKPKHPNDGTASTDPHEN